MVNGVTIERVISIRVRFKVLSFAYYYRNGWGLTSESGCAQPGSVGKARLLAKVKATAKAPVVGKASALLRA